MPAGYPMRNPRIIRFLYQDFIKTTSDGDPDSCVEQGKRNGTISQPPIVRHTPGGIYSNQDALALALKSYNCQDNTFVVEGDGVTFVTIKDPPTFQEGVSPDCVPNILSPQQIGQQLKDNNPEKFFELRPFTSIIDEVFPETDVAIDKGLYGPRVLTFLISQNPIAFPNPDVTDRKYLGYSWPPTGWNAAIKRYAQQRGLELFKGDKLEDRWVQYDTYLSFDQQSFIRRADTGTLSTMLGYTSESIGYESATLVTDPGNTDLHNVVGVKFPLYKGWTQHDVEFGKYPLPYPDSVESNPNCPDGTKGATDAFQTIIDDFYSRLT